MATSHLSEVIQHLRRTVFPRDGAGLTDGRLLELFLTDRDDAALAALVRRHGRMVWGVCRRILFSDHDAEDAFQTTFLVLVRKAISIKPREMVASWLHGVAYQTALKARSVAAKRRARERQVEQMPEPAVAKRPSWDDLRPVIDHEVSCLPEKYRIALVLCDMEGKTRKEAAAQLGWPEGSVAGRLATARQMLGKRLVRRGVVVSGGVLAALLTNHTATASVPPLLVGSTIKAATLFATGQAAAGVISADVAALTTAMLNASYFSAFKTTVICLLGTALTIGALGIGLTFADLGDADPHARPIAKATILAEDNAIKPDKSLLEGSWRATKLTSRGETFTFPNNNGLVFHFADQTVTISAAAGDKSPIGGPPWGKMPDGKFGGPPPPWAKQGEGKGGGPSWPDFGPGPGPVFGPGGRWDPAFMISQGGHPWAKPDPNHFKLLRDHVKRTPNGELTVQFGIKLDADGVSMDRFLAINGAEAFLIRGVYLLRDDSLTICEGPPGNPRPSLRDAETAANCSAWTLERLKR